MLSAARKEKSFSLGATSKQNPSTCAFIAMQKSLPEPEKTYFQLQCQEHSELTGLHGDGGRGPR